MLSPRLPVRLLKHPRSMIRDTRLIACEHISRLMSHPLNCVHDALLGRAYIRRSLWPSFLKRAPSEKASVVLAILEDVHVDAVLIDVSESAPTLKTNRRFCDFC
jgi:hypothetical protein